MTAEDIKQKFPNPKTATNKHGGLRKNGYCVLGAACRYVTSSRRYSYPGYLSASLMLGIFPDEAAAITAVNDDGDFESAWKLLDIALKRKR